MLKALLLVLLIAAPPMVKADTPGLIDEAFRAAQDGMASAAGVALAQIGQRAATGTGALADLLRKRQALADALRDTEDALATSGADTVMLGGQTRQLTGEIAGLDARIAADFPRYAELTQPVALGTAQVAALLHPDEAMIVYFVGREQTYVWAISPKSQGWFRIGATRDLISDTVAKLRATAGDVAVARGAVALMPEPDTPKGFNRILAASMYETLLQPLEPVFGEARHLYIVPDGPLTSLPFAMLVTDTNVEGDNADPVALRSSAWMIRRHAITTLPSVESLGVVRRMEPKGNGTDRRDQFAGYGDPVLGGTMQLASLSRGPGVMREGLANVDQLRSLSPLPQTRAELTSIAATLGAGPASVHVGEQATERAVKQADLSQTKVLAFATHGLLSGDLAGLLEPALVLTPPATATRWDDGLLTASEIADLRLNADWVVLSACNTAGGEGPGAEGLSGLARAFLFAGARSILVTHWPVRDDAAARLTTDTFARLARGDARGKAEALQQAMLALMDDTSDPTLADPSAWAPFALVGEGG